MFKKQIEKRAQRIMSKLTRLGFTKNGSAMVIDQAREIVAAEEGYRNWHAFNAAAKDGKPSQATPDAAALLRVLKDLLAWAEHTGGWDAPVWHAARRLAGDTEPDESLPSEQAVTDWLRDQISDGKIQPWDVPGLMAHYAFSAPEDLIPTLAAEMTQPTGADNWQTVQEGEGWGLFEAHGDTVELQIQRDDEAEIFENDEEAWAHVIRKAHEQPQSAEAQAITRIFLESPSEYRRLAAFDAEHERLLPRRSSAGHPVDLKEVGGWVGTHYKENFDTTSGATRQSWIDRFAMAQADAGDERFFFYLVAEDWQHRFSVLNGSHRTRWVLKLGGENEGIVFAQIYDETKGWQTLRKKDARLDIQESVYDNDIPDTWRTAWSSEVKPCLCLPSWAKDLVGR